MEILDNTNIPYIWNFNLYAVLNVFDAFDRFVMVKVKYVYKYVDGFIFYPSFCFMGATTSSSTDTAIEQQLGKKQLKACFSKIRNDHFTDYVFLKGL